MPLKGFSWSVTFCVFCFYEAVDTMPTPEFHLSFSIGRTIFVLTFSRMQLVEPILSNHKKATKIAYFASAAHANSLLLSMAYGT